MKTKKRIKSVFKFALFICFWTTIYCIIKDKYYPGVYFAVGTAVCCIVLSFVTPPFPLEEDE